MDNGREQTKKERINEQIHQKKWALLTITILYGK
jgi:hypothetical protein